MAEIITDANQAPQAHGDSNQSAQPSSGISPMMIGGIILVAVVAILGYMLFGRPQSDDSAVAPAVQEQATASIEPTASPAASPDTTTQITLAEIAKHNTATDCWFAIEGNVYDVTGFIASNKHPGGDAIIQGCGKDATVLFNTRPMSEEKTPHSERARSMLPQFQIGVLAK